MPFCLEKAERVRDFIEHLKFSAGEFRGKQFKLADWQWECVIKPFFGTVDDDGLRTYRFCYVEVPKKNGKSEIGAAIALYLLCGDREGSPEVYSAAADISQASRLYQPAAYMARNNDDLNKAVNVRDSRKTIYYPKNDGFYKVLSADVKTKHGLNPHGVLFDELHAQPHDELWRVLTAGTNYARRQQAVFVFTTAGIWDVESVWWRVRSKAIQIQSGIVKQDNFLPVLFIADPEKDDPEDRNLWKRVNPSLNVIFDMKKIEEDYQDAKSNPIDYADFLRFRLNIPIKSVLRWMPMQDWDKCAGEVPDLEGKTCFGGLDLSTKIDLTAFALVFPPQEGLAYYAVLMRFYVPEDTVMERSRSDHVHYNVWVDEEYITATGGNVIDTGYIKNDIVEASEKYDLQEVGYDPWMATQLATELFNDYNIQCVEMRQGAKSLSDPAKDLLVKVKQHRVRHGGNPVLRWCADNLVMTVDANENVRPDKAKATERIDGMVALIEAWGRMIFTYDGPSVYEGRGIEVIEA
jgi:phage terminase large subunit-like protein